MSLALLALIVLAVLATGYLVYGRYIARQFNLDDARITPATQQADGIDFVPTRPFYLLGQHFSAIAAAGPIVGPILACLSFGWVPCLLWIGIGVVFIGAVHDFASLVASVRHGATSIADIARQNLSKRAYVALVAFIWLALLYVIVAFTDVTAGTFVGKSEELAGLGGTVRFNVGGAVAAASVMYLALAMVMGVVQQFLKPPMWLATAIFVPATVGVIWLGTQFSTVLVFDAKVWYIAILVYCLGASMLPLWLLQQPRGYLGGFVLYLAIGVGLVGVLFGGFAIQQPAFAPVADYGGFFGVTSAAPGWAPGAGGAGPTKMTDLVFPFLFVTIACGACSGFHGLVCGGTTCRQIAKESHCKPVAFGAMLLEGFVAVIALATVMILTRDETRAYAGRPGAMYGDGLARFITKVMGLESEQSKAFARTFGQMAVATFVFDTLDVATRLGRYLLQELTGARSRLAGFIASALTAGIPLLILLTAAKGSYLLFWTLFGTSNQLLASLTLLGLTVWLYRTGRKCWYVFIPMLFVMTITLTALSIQIFVGARDAGAGRWRAGEAFNPTILNAGAGLMLLALAVVFIVEGLGAARRVRASHGSAQVLAGRTGHP
jgi:carbon starvation protein